MRAMRTFCADRESRSSVTRRGQHRFGYPLRDGILYQPGRESSLRGAFLDRGYTVT